MTDQMIVPMLLRALVENLTLHMQTNVQPDDLSYADIIKIGLLQSNKTAKNVQLGVTGGDHEDPNYLDSIITAKGLQDQAGINFGYAREIGGGQLWFRRGVVRAELFFVREHLVEDEATDVAYEILGRIQQHIEDVDLTGLEDDFGERAVLMLCTGNTFFESGGAPKSFIFRGKIFWSCVTERP